MSFKLRNARERYQILHFIFSKNVKIGIKCSIAVPDSPLFINNFRGLSGFAIEHLIPILTFFENIK